MSEPIEPEPATALDRVRRTWEAEAGEVASFDKVIGRHRERHRTYHRVEHVLQVAEQVLDLGACESIDEAELRLAFVAAVYHDAIYEPRSPANERASARLARRDLVALGWPGDDIERVAAMIEGTKTHLDPRDTATAVLFDADLAILGAPPDIYEGYRVAVRQEYQHVSDHDWQTGRAAVLDGFLDRTPIYATATARGRWEHSARRNLSSELADLSD